MVEKILEKGKGSEPRETRYDVAVKALDDLMRQRATGKVIVKGKEINFEQNRQGFIKFLILRDDWGEVSTPGWAIFINRIHKHSGKHAHQGGLAIYVLDGEGYTEVDGEKYDWEQGDLIVLPLKPGGVEHQHFNKNPHKPAEWLAFVYYTMLDVIDMGIVQKAEAPDWAKSK